MPSQRELANAVRMLSIDAVQAAQSGHPGMPMGMADIAEVLWRQFLKHNPLNPNWIDRDRFILSNGHGVMLLYSVLHLSGYDVSLEDIKQFRQLHSKAPGHPEYGITPGVEATTGPLGQGLANGVGMAIAERHLAGTFNREGHEIVNHYTYVFMGDGCLMEGISHEACSLAGLMGLGKLIVFWDDNGISIDGKVSGWFKDDTPKRFEAYGWHVSAQVDGHNAQAVQEAILSARAVTDQPSLIVCKTTIGYGSPNLAGTAKAHGAHLGENEVVGCRQRLEWRYPPFEIPSAIYADWDAKAAGKAAEYDWQQRLSAYQAQFPDLAKDFLRRVNRILPDDWLKNSRLFIQQQSSRAQSIATRKASLEYLEHNAKRLPELFGGSADLTGSNCTAWSGSISLTADNFNSGNYIHYGVREFGMFSIMNGLALHGGIIPYGGTFLVFSDYGRNALRLSALMGQRVIYVLTHDSIGLGEDGPTHQPVEHINMLRLTPNLHVWRPCDAVETAVAWESAILRQEGPTSLLLTRQSVPHQVRTPFMVSSIARGGYIVFEPDLGEDSSNSEMTPDALIIATGSEVGLAVEASKQIKVNNGLRVRVVSMPCVEVFEAQDAKYREKVLPPGITARVAVEAGSCAFWYKYVGLDGLVIGLDQFGYSAPAKAVLTALGFTVERVANAVLQVLSHHL